ncbi:hypothetical protein JSY36_08360 [Bacillus sp. H-16]|uniref:phosphate signaling complex PhoU family protein n=1 Tax=Alteribacter salitolerans TaxID=2912333 RepID=UPI0019629A32|nr:PhoU domain-containing protein [Alteribacter salitolerans]MBM7095764.1 hypothetical protein [Alteribacter salitolerans]
MTPIMKNFSYEMNKVHDRLLVLAEMTEGQFALTQNVVAHGATHVNKVKKLDRDIDEKYEEIQKGILNMFIIQTPLPNEIKALTTIMRMSGELERIGDQMVNMMASCEHLKHEDSRSYATTVIEMLGHAGRMHEMCTSILKTYDEEKATTIIETDRLVDQAFHHFRTELPQLIQEHPQYIEDFMQYFLISRYIERAADHIVNIVKRINLIT